MIYNKTHRYLLFFYSILLTHWYCASFAQIQSLQQVNSAALQAVAYSIHGTQNASTFLQTLGKEASVLAGLPQNQAITVKYLAPTSPLYTTAIACNCNGEVFVRPDQEYNKNNYGLIRLTLIHEMTHRKQFDIDTKKFRVLKPTQYNSIEKEADIEAAYRGNCVHCTTEYAQSAYSQNNTSKRAQKCRATGYATKEELLAIADQQKKCNACCQHHRYL